ncbi:MAG TPA: hypothetical protein VLG14_17160 [Sphingomonas sp.]|nr:hypothetical protein [Sphingomonas sp.]
MTVIAARVRALIERLASEPVCDDCIAERLALTEPEQAGHTTRELAGSDGFVRAIGPCALCGAAKTVIRAGQR